MSSRSYEKHKQSYPFTGKKCYHKCSSIPAAVTEAEMAKENSTSHLQLFSCVQLPGGSPF